MCVVVCARVLYVRIVCVVCVSITCILCLCVCGYLLCVCVCTCSACMLWCVHACCVCGLCGACMRIACVCAWISASSSTGKQTCFALHREGAPSDLSPGLLWGPLPKVTPGACPGQFGNASLGCGPAKRTGRGRWEGQGVGDSQGPGRGDGHWLEGPAWPWGPDTVAPLPAGWALSALIRFCLSSFCSSGGKAR